MSKKIDEGGYLEFLEYFKKEYPLLRERFPKQIEWSMLSLPYGVWKPDNMSDEDFDEFRRIEFEWLLENGYIPKYDSEILFVTPLPNNEVHITIDPKQVIRVIKQTSNTTNIIVVGNSNIEVSYIVVGNIDYVNSKLGIGLPQN